MGNKNFYASFCFLTESFTLSEVEELQKKIPFPQLHSRTKKICSVMSLEKDLVFCLYGSTIKLLLTNEFGPNGNIFGP